MTRCSRAGMCSRGLSEVVVVNVFAGVPASLAGPAWWDRYTGATDSLVRVRERVGEDRRALGLAGRTAVNLDLLDEQYREADQPPAPPTARLERVLAPSARDLRAGGVRLTTSTMRSSRGRCT